MREKRFSLHLLLPLSLAGEMVAAHGAAATKPWYGMSFLLVILAAAILYGRGISRLWRRAGAGRGLTRGQVAAHYAALAVLIAVLYSPLELLSRQLFAAHMTQHLLVILVTAPLLVYSRPLLAYLWALPPAIRRHPLGRFLPRPSHPATVLIAGAGFFLVLGLWHLPSLYQSALRSDWVHGLEHLCFLAAAMAFWGIILHGGRAHALALLFLATVFGALVAALISFAPTPWYPAYAATAPARGYSPLEDQQLGGLIMLAGGLIYLGAGLAVLACWLRQLHTRHITPVAGNNALQAVMTRQYKLDQAVENDR